MEKDSRRAESTLPGDGRSVGNREAGSLPRVGRFGVRRRGRLLDRRPGRGHFGRGRLSLVAECRGRSCSRLRQRVEGALTGTPATGDATLKFSVLSGVAAMIETMPLERAAEAYAKMMSGKARFRMVLTVDR